MRAIDAGAGLIVRPTTPADLDWVLEAEGAPEQRPFVTHWPRERHEQVMRAGDAAHAIIDAGGERAGYVVLRGIGDPDGSIELTRIVVTRKGEGVGRRVLRALARHAFLALGAHRFWLDVFDHNERAHGLYRTEGFVEEGRLRECVLRDGTYRTLIVMSMLDREFPASPAAAGG